MEKPIHAHQPGQEKPSADSAIRGAASGGEQAEELLTRAVSEALAAGRSWAQIGGRLGVPPPVARRHAVVTERDWQEAIVAHEIARAARHNDPEHGRS
ncbi:hypothetical protein [Rhodococcus sp. WAY2]|uniref:hypothetical protein n=1 Tax=Rhodococcus sp. WAY2 TaxID=2663121 RepID=UPI00131FAA9E|nr:hypothetical protein [Rhodococcus sp. WAY2]QHE73156.1 hypothetical protein GFS60_06809 [Rhodococcus sp. WAY2]